MLLDKLGFGNREPIAQKKILQGVMMQNVENVENLLAAHFEVITQGIATQPVESQAAAHKAIERLARVGKSLGFERADGLDGIQLHQRIEFFKFTQSLSGKSNLKHSRAAWASDGVPASPAWRMRGRTLRGIPVTGFHVAALRAVANFTDAFVCGLPSAFSSLCFFSG